MALYPGVRLGPYEILAPLGAGGMGEVYRAKDPRLGREVAIKVLPASFSQDPDRLRRFEQEARAASALNHPNILTIHDIGTHDGSPYVVSELLEGETLRARLAGGAFTPRKALGHSLQIAHGLAAAHEKGIVHRDLKPENIFVTRDGRVKILDFGLAKLTQSENAASPLTDLPTAGTEPGVVLGTLGYMSPEQVRGRPADPRSDIFSFGAILYEMLSSRRAFRGDTAADTMAAILKQEPPEISQTNLPPALGRVVRHCLEKSPEERFHSAHDLAFDLKAILTGFEISEPSPLARAGQAHRARWLISIGIALAALFTLSRMLLWRDRPPARAEAARIESVAVLPLENLSGDPEQDYFADGMTEALISDLAQISALRVISRTSVMQYKGAKKPLPRIAQELKVDGIVEGSVLRAGNRVRITAQLVQGTADQHLWARSYERDFRDVLTLQREVAQAIAREIQIKLTPQEKARLAQPRPVDPEAHEAYLKGRYYWNKRTEKGLKKAIEYFEEAIERDPASALAYTGLADSYSLLAEFYHLSPKEAFPKAEAAAKKALAVDPTLPEAHNSLGWIRYRFGWDWSGAEKEFQRAIELNASYATAHHWYADYLTAMGRLDEASREIRRAEALDPLSLPINRDVAWHDYFARRYDQAIGQLRRTLEMDPNFVAARTLLGRVYVQKGWFDEAVAEFQKAADLSQGGLTPVALLAYAYASSGKRREAIKILSELRERSEEGDVSPSFLAAICAALDDKEQAFEWLEKGYRERAGALIYLKVDPMFKGLSSDPRFEALLRRVGLPP